MQRLFLIYVYEMSIQEQISNALRYIGWQVASLSGDDESICCFCAEITTAYSVKHLAGTCGVPALSLDPTRLPVCFWSCGEQLGSGTKDLRFRMVCYAFQCLSSGVSMLGVESWDLEEPMACCMHSVAHLFLHPLQGGCRWALWNKIIFDAN
jgi:hypothetical protein